MRTFMEFFSDFEIIFVNLNLRKFMFSSYLIFLSPIMTNFPYQFPDHKDSTLQPAPPSRYPCSKERTDYSTYPDAMVANRLRN